MHYYQFNIGDYLSHTRHLTVIEDICYRRALDHYYLHEKPLSLDINHLARVLLLSEYGKQLSVVLNEFFEKTEFGYINSRADKEIQQYQGFAEAGKRGAAKRWSKGGDSPHNSPPTQPLMLNNKQEPITNNHKPNTKGTRLPKNWQPTTEYIDFCKKERPDLNPDGIADEFRDYWISVAGAKGVKLDWFATWRNWVRSQRSQQTIKQKESQAWRSDDTLMVQMARELGVNTTGKTRFEVIAAIDKKRGAV